MRRQRRLNGGEGGDRTHRPPLWSVGVRRVVEATAISLILLAVFSGGRVLVRQPAVSAALSRGRRDGPTRRATHHFRMLFVGASITAGMGADEPSQAYPQLVADRVGRREGPVTLTVIAHTGARASRALKWSYPSGQNVVIVHLATNDFLHATPIPTYKSDLHTVLRHLRRGSPHATLICLGAWVSPSAVNRDHLGPAIYDAVEQGDCRSFRGHFVSLENLYAHPQYHDPAPLQVGPALPHAGTVAVGGRRVAFHPNDAGHAAIARAVYAELERTHALPRATT